MTTCRGCVLSHHDECDTTDGTVAGDPCACWQHGHGDGVLLQTVIPGTPQPQGSHVANPYGGGVRDANKKLAPWRAVAIATLAAEMRDRNPIVGGVILRASFNFARPASHYRTGRNTGLVRTAAPIVHAQTPDLDKLLRALGDALTQAGAIQDDKQIAQVVSRKTWTTASPHTWLRLGVVE